MIRPQPINKQTIVSLEEMFFSITDSRGVILEGNEVFRKISQYSKDELVGSPHNIIRHPDMPKIVFKALWATIQAGRPICAYVKNLAKDGSYYWVFTTVMPLGENYISIRMKPTTALLGIIEQLYPVLLKVEDEKGVDASLDLLVQSLNSLGISDYDTFVLLAITQELFSRNDLLQKQQSSLQKNSLFESFDYQYPFGKRA